jgi:hypothetical protein
VLRAYSHWKLNRIDGVEPLDFEAALAAEAVRMRRAEALRSSDPWRYAVLIDRYAYVGHSRYVDDVERYRSQIPSDRLLFVCAEEMFADPVPTFNAMLAFLGLAPFQLPELPAQNASNDDAPPPAVARRLAAELRDPTRALCATLDRSFPWACV